MNPSTDSIEKTLGMHASGKRPLIKYLIIALVALTFIGAAFWVWYDKKNSSALEYLTAPAQIRTLTTTVSATGNLEPTNTVEVGIEVSGTIEEVFVDFNDRVHVGQLMARLDTTRLASQVTSSKASVARYRANIAEAEAAYINARNEWERVQAMVSSTGGNYPSRQEVDNARASMDKTRAQVAAAQALLAQAQAELITNEDNVRKAKVVSPVEGIVLDRKVERGQTVVASMQTPVLFTMAEDLTKMKVIVSVDEADIGEVRENQQVRFSVDAYPDKTFTGIITQLRLNSQIVSGVVTYDAVVTVNNHDLLLRPGMTASAQIVTGVLRDVLTVPNAALRFTPPSPGRDEKKRAKSTAENNTRYVWILRDNQPEKVAVKATKSDGASTAVTAPSLKAGDAIIIGTKETE